MITWLRRWTVLAGILMWLVIALPVLAGNLIVAPSAWWWVGYIAFGVLLIVQLVPRVARWSPRWLIWVQLLTGAATFSLDGGYGFSSVLLVLNAILAALTLSLRYSLSVVVAQTAIMIICRYVWGHGPTDLVPIAEAGVFAAFQLFAVATMELTLRERRRRAELAAANLELAAAQTRLAEASRSDERLRIARDLHDTLGHQLTALAVTLELASHLVDAPGLAAVERSRDLAKQTLGELRSAVGRLRDGPVCLKAALQERFDTVPGLRVHVEVQPGLPAADPARADAVIRCCQEIVTNALRHADADHVWLSVARADDSVVVSGRDDGPAQAGRPGITLGNGLVGMRERFEQLGGTVSFAAGEGFAVEARLPAW